MSPAAIVLAQFGLGAAALKVVHVIAAIGGAFVGWFVSDPIARITHRVVTRKAIPSWTLPWIKMAGAALCGLLIYFFILFGGGPGGWGYGLGLGGGPGKGPGEGGKDTGALVQNGGKPADKTRPLDKGKPADKTVRKRLDIEVLGAKRVRDADHCYLLIPDDKKPGTPMTLKDVEGYFKEHGSKMELHVILTDDSPDEGLGIIEDLTRLADRYQVPSVIHRPIPKKRP
jgi:hypothetical protein